MKSIYYSSCLRRPSVGFLNVQKQPEEMQREQDAKSTKNTSLLYCQQPRHHHSPRYLQAQHTLDICSHHVFVFLPSFTPHFRSLHVGRALVIRLGKHAHHRDEDLLDRLDRRPSLRRLLVVVRVVARRVEDRDTDKAARIYYKREVVSGGSGQSRDHPRTIRMPDICKELHGRRG